MHLVIGASTGTWEPTVSGADTTNIHYWLNWRFLSCAIWVLSCIIIAFHLIWKYEGPGTETEQVDGVVGSEDNDRQRRKQESPGVLYDDESWRPCLKEVHPAWLLAFRLISFFVLLGLLIVIIVVDGGSIFYYYTQWTFILITIYFGLGSLLSIYGCQQYLSKVGGENSDTLRSDMERGMYLTPRTARNANLDAAKSVLHDEHFPREIAGFGGYLFQIIYQTNAGAVMLTDFVFWLVIFPYLSVKEYNLNLLLIGMHSVNAVFLLGDAALNSLRFPSFRISYFFLWTGTYVIFQWIVHASTRLWWPYPFLDLSDHLSPLYYFGVAAMQVPCYFLFALIIKFKDFLLSRWFHETLDAVK